MTLLILRQSKSPLGPGSVDTEVPDWLNKHEKFPFNCQETSSWVGLPEWLFLWLRILFLFGRAGPKIAIFPPSAVLWQIWERKCLISSVEAVFLYSRGKWSTKGIFILRTTCWIMSVAQASLCVLQGWEKKELLVLGFSLGWICLHILSYSSRLMRGNGILYKSFCRGFWVRVAPFWLPVSWLSGIPSCVT